MFDDDKLSLLEEYAKAARMAVTDNNQEIALGWLDIILRKLKEWKDASEVA